MALKKTTVRRGRERRMSERADARLSMRVDAAAVVGATRIVTESQNISASGVYCHTSHYLAPLSKVQLTIVLPKVPGGAGGPQELLKCDAIVVRCSQRSGGRTETPYDLACMFVSLDAVLKVRVAEFVKWRNLQALRDAVAQPKPRKKRVRLAVVGGARKKAAVAKKPALAKKSALAKKPAVAKKPSARGGQQRGKQVAPRAGRPGR